MGFERLKGINNILITGQNKPLMKIENLIEDEKQLLHKFNNRMNSTKLDILSEQIDSILKIKEIGYKITLSFDTLENINKESGNILILSILKTKSGMDLSYYENGDLCEYKNCKTSWYTIEDIRRYYWKNPNKGIYNGYQNLKIKCEFVGG